MRKNKEGRRLLERGGWRSTASRSRSALPTPEAADRLSLTFGDTCLQNMALAIWIGSVVHEVDLPGLIVEDQCHSVR